MFDLIGGDIGKRSARLVRAGGTLVSIVGPVEARPADGRAIDFVVETDLAQLGAIGLHHKIDRPAVGWPRLDRPDDRHQGSAGADQARGPLADIAADEIEHQIDLADVFQGFVVQIDELVRAEVERLLAVGGASGADDVGARLSRQLRHHRSHRSRRAVREDALTGPKTAVFEQPLPSRQARDRQAGGHREVDVARERREVARLHGDELRQGSVAMPVRETEHALSDRQPRRAVTKGRDHAGQFVPGDRRCSIAVAAIGPGRGPTQLRVDETRRMNLDHDVVDRRLRLGPLDQLHPGRSRGLVCHHDRLHRDCLLGHSSIWWTCRADGRAPLRRGPG